jgi:flagellar biogenesis protein FliO
VSFWALPAWWIVYGPFSSSVAAGGNNDDGIATVGGSLLIAGVVFIIVWRLRRMMKNSRAKSHARKRAKRMDGLLEPELESE